MSLTADQIAAAGAALFEAERGRRQIGLLSRRYRAMAMTDAYSVQADFVRRKLAAGRRVIGWKIGLTSKAMQDALQIDIPDSGVLLDDMRFADRATIPAGRFIQPRIEAEIAFLMRAPLKGPGVTRAQVIAATDRVAPALELLDTRILRRDPASGAARRICDTVADNAVNAGLVLGAARHAADAHELRWVGAIVTRDGAVGETGLGAGVLGGPAMGLVWLANRPAAYGLEIAAGQVVLSGSFVRPVEAPGGSVIEAELGAFGRVGCRFA